MAERSHLRLAPSGRSLNFMGKITLAKEVRVMPRLLDPPNDQRSSFVALTLDGIKAVTWTVRNGHDRAANALADRHYSRRKPGSGQVGGPARRLVFVSPCERAVWLTKWPLAEVAKDGLDAYRCSIFRNEGAGLSSELIVAAMELTERLWGPPPVDAWVTWVDTTKVESPHPGYCFKQAGWWLDREWSHPRKIRLRAESTAASLDHLRRRNAA